MNRRSFFQQLTMMLAAAIPGIAWASKLIEAASTSGKSIKDDLIVSTKIDHEVCQISMYWEDDFHYIDRPAREPLLCIQRTFAIPAEASESDVAEGVDKIYSWIGAIVETHYIPPDRRWMVKYENLSTAR